MEGVFRRGWGISRLPRRGWIAPCHLGVACLLVLCSAVRKDSGVGKNSGEGRQQLETRVSVLGPRGSLFSIRVRALISCCCAVTRAQHLGQHNNRIAQKSPRGWLRAAQHAILVPQHFSPQAKHVLLRVLFSPQATFSSLFFCGGASAGGGGRGLFSI